MEKDKDETVQALQELVSEALNTAMDELAASLEQLDTELTYGTST